MSWAIDERTYAQRRACALVGWRLFAAGSATGVCTCFFSGRA